MPRFMPVAGRRELQASRRGRYSAAPAPATHDDLKGIEADSTMALPADDVSPSPRLPCRRRRRRRRRTVPLSTPPVDDSDDDLADASFFVRWSRHHPAPSPSCSSLLSPRCPAACPTDTPTNR